MLNKLSLQFLLWLYPIDPPNLKRDRPLEVLALGLSRTGTESLQQALHALGYSEVYHGFRAATRTNHKLQWIRLGMADSRGDRNFLNVEEFDRILGDCAALTDIPCAGFAQDLIRVYPNAKIIVNHRRDVEAWYNSVIESIVNITDRQPWYEYILSFFQSDLFWQQRSYYWIWQRYVDRDFRRNGKEWYRRHYEGLAKALPSGSYLEWTVEDGWEPLCKFLDKPVPKEAFPHGNTPKDFLATAAANRARWRAEAKRNMRKIGAIAATIFITSLGAAFLPRLGPTS